MPVFDPNNPFKIAGGNTNQNASKMPKSSGNVLDLFKVGGDNNSYWNAPTRINANAGVLGASTIAPNLPLPDVPTQGQVYSESALGGASYAAPSLVTQRRGDVTSKLNQYNSLFDGLFGRIDAAAADQANTTRKNYGTQRTDLTSEYNQQVPGIDMSYYLGGVGDSSLRLAGLGKAESALKSGIAKVDANEANDLAEIGQYAAAKRAGYEADRSQIENIRNLINQSSDANELLQLQNDLQTKIAGLNADSAGFGTGGQFRQELASRGAAQDASPIRSTLNSLVQGAANPALKRQIATQIIDNAAVPQSTKDELYATYVNGTV